MKAFSILIFLLFQCAIIAQPNLDWKKNYGGSGDDIADQILTTSNGYFISGSTTSQDGDFVDNPYDTAHFIFKVNEQGVIDWINYYQREVIAIALDWNKDLLFLKDLDNRTIHLEKLDNQGQTIYEDQIISVNRTIVPRDLAMHGDGQIRIVGELASPWRQDGIFQCTYNERNRNTNFIYKQRTYSGVINNYIDVIVGIEEFFNSDMFIRFVWFDRGGTADYLPLRIREICDLNPYGSIAFDSESAACSDGSILLSCDKLIKIYQDTIYTLEFNGPKNPLTGSENYNWTYNQSDDDFLIMAIDNQGNSLYTLNYNGSETDFLKEGNTAEDQGLVLLINSTSNDGDFPINKGGEDVWVFKNEGCDNICISVNNTVFKTCPQDSLLLEPYIAGCFDCTYTWEDGVTSLRRKVEAEVSDSFELTISNNMNFDTSLIVYLDVVPLPTLEYEVTFNSDCPGSEYQIVFDTLSCPDCEIFQGIRFSNTFVFYSMLDSNILSLYPMKDEIYLFKYRLGECEEIIEIPIDIYDFEAQVNYSFCSDSNFVEVLPVGGNGVINILWDDGNQEFQRFNLEEGFHNFVLSDSLCSIGDSTSQSNFLNPYPDSRTFSQNLNDTSAISYSIEIEPIEQSFIETYYYHFLVKYRNGVVVDFDLFSIVIDFVLLPKHKIIVEEDHLIIEESLFGNIEKFYTYDLDLELISEMEPELPFLQTNGSILSRVENGDTLWSTNFIDIVRGASYYNDSSQLIVYGNDLVSFVDFSIGSIIESNQIGGSKAERFYDVITKGEQIIVIGSTSSIDGDLQDIHSYETTGADTFSLWVFEMDENFNIKWNYIFKPQRGSHGDAELRFFKDGILATHNETTVRLTNDGNELWRSDVGNLDQILGDTIQFFRNNVFYDTYQFNGVTRDSLNIDQDSIITVTSTPGSNILWSTGDTTSTITVSDPGTYTVQIESPDGCVTLDTIIVFARSVANYDIDLENHTIQVYPNPNNGEFIVESEAKIQSIRIVNAMGKVMQEVQFPNGVNKHRINLNTDFAGLYIVQCQINNSWLNKKIITMNQ